ncbi:hypothetical protein NXX38_00860 [Bacteroides sp. BFG-637]|nr:hypothetical protein [Bacteroides sp. BFG-637]MCS3310629.1 hypothetical protein [Bacteroides sp. BFG-637]
MAEYKTNLAAKVFNDLLKPIQVVETEEKSALPQINLKQYEMLKGKHPDALLLFRNGDNYESYAEDADKVSKLLKFDKAIGMESGSKNQVDIVSFSGYDLDTVLPNLIRAGNRVAICDKVEHKETIDNEQQEEVRAGRHL